MGQLAELFGISLSYVILGRTGRSVFQVMCAKKITLVDVETLVFTHSHQAPKDSGRPTH